MLAAQVRLLVLIGALGYLNPVDDMSTITYLVILLAFCAATQDIAIDAYRREILSDKELGLGNSVHINAYRVAGLVPGSLSLILADSLSWNAVFWITALFMLPGMAMAMLVSEPIVSNSPRSLREACVQPFLEFIRRQGLQGTLLVIAFLFFYKLGDSLATALITPFYLRMNFSLTDIGLIAKNAGLWSAVIGAIMGGLIMERIGINKALWLFGAVQLVTIFGFVWLSWIGPFEAGGITIGNRIALTVVVSAEYLGVGLGTVAFIAFIARNTNPVYAATQFALFTSLATLPRTVVNAFAGIFVDALGWTLFFLLCVLLAVPGMLLLFKVAPWSQEDRR
jgi:PAT family beta-lactamase induction signal transducer AmpG